MANRIQHLLLNWACLVQSSNSSYTRKKIFHEIWDDYHKRLLFFITKIVGEDAEDVLQDIMMRVYEKLDTYNPIYSFNTWIYTIARNNCINHLEKRKITTISIEQDVTIQRGLIQHDMPDRDINKKEIFQKIDTYIAQLDSGFQQIAFLRFYEGMKIKAIAKIMNIPAGTVKSRIYHIKKALRRELEEFYES